MDHTHQRETDLGDNIEAPAKLNEKSYIQIGLMFAIIGFIVGAVWWASAMQSKMDQVIEEVKATRVLSSKVSDNDTRIKILEMRMDQVINNFKKP